MSMPNWLNDAQPFPNTDNGAFNPAADPSMGFMQTPTASSFNFNQLQNPQLQQRMQNGNIRNGSPAYNNPIYPTQPVIPSKRPRPREDSIGASPRQQPGGLPPSRSQTPQGAYPGFQGAVNGNQQFQGTPSYQQYQQAGSNASPSPIIHNQGFNPQAAHQRVQTMSPSPFSPAAQNFGAHASPTQSEHASRVSTPQNGTQQYAQSLPYGGGPGQQFPPQLGSTVNGTPMSQYNPQVLNPQQQQQRMNEIRMRQLQQYRQQGGVVNPLAQHQNQVPNPQMAALRAQHAQQAQQRSQNPEQMLRTISLWMQQRALPFSPQAVIGGRPMSGMQIFYVVMRMQGSRSVETASQWPKVAAMLGFPTAQCMSFGQEIRSYYHTNLAPYENFMRQQQQSQQQRAMVDPSRASVNPDEAVRPDAFSPTKQIHSQQAQQLMQPPQQMHPHYQTPAKQMPSQQHDSRQPMQNGYMTQQQGHPQVRPSNMYSSQQTTMQVPPRTVLPQVQDVRTTIKKRRGKEPKNRPSEQQLKEPWKLMPLLVDKELDEEYEPYWDNLDRDVPKTHGGVEVSQPDDFLETMTDLLKYRLSVPKVEELGVIDIRALTLSIRSGMHAEVRLALDTLASLSKDASALPLDSCEDLLEVLIDCADDQVELLAEHAAEVSDAMLVNSYEETVRACKVENMILQEDPEFGTLDYELDRAVDRLICITTILRNYSFLDDNLIVLANPIVTRLLSTVIRYLGTRNMLLRTHSNTLDFSKDAIIFLSNVSPRIDLPGKEEALCILHFLLSFAPLPAPNSAETGELAFSSYNPALHRYFSHAVDTLAKLLARDEPNRTFYRSILSAENSSTPPYDLLTRVFGLAVAAVPDADNRNLKSIVRVRTPYLVQGLLAAEILASLIPASEPELARSWLASHDGFALSLMRIVSELGREPPFQPQRHHSGRLVESENGNAMITHRGLAVLRKLAEKAKDADTDAKGLPFGVLPDKQSVLLAMQTIHEDPNTTNLVRQLCALSGLDS